MLKEYFVRIVAGHWYDAWYAGTQEVMKLRGSGRQKPKLMSLLVLLGGLSYGYQPVSGNEILCTGTNGNAAKWYFYRSFGLS